MLLAFLELLLVIFSLVVLITQLILPAINGQKLFPFFRKQGKLEKELDDAKQAVVEHNLEVQIEETLNSVQSEPDVVIADESLSGESAAVSKPKVKRKPAAPKPTAVTPVVKPKAKRKPKEQ